MRTSRFARAAFLGVAVTATLILVANAAIAATTTVAYSFAGDEDGEYPSTELVMDAAGNLYGTTVQGGEFGGGSVFQLAPDGSGGWTHTVLYSFTGGADGGQPYGGVTLDAQGNLYGTAVIGGTGGVCTEDGCGVAYELAEDAGTWHQHVLHAFTGGADGSGPGAGLTFDQDGNLYGMTPTGGAFGLGTIYQLHPNGTGQWKLRVVHAFTGGADGGAASAGRLLLAGDGSLYGVATVGGAFGQGVAFQLVPAISGGFHMTSLYDFQGQPDAGFPYGGLTMDARGNLYGTTYYDGANDLGSVYQLSKRGSGQWRESVLYSFSGGSDGASPISTLNLDAQGNLYGTTSEGGAAGCGCGTIFQLARRGGGWTERVVYRFTGSPDGAFPYNGMVSDGAGSYFGTTVHGGADGEGSVYRFTP
jgi:uncharacterized repeat protein (TIGR03803 family)